MNYKITSTKPIEEKCPNELCKQGRVIIDFIHTVKCLNCFGEGKIKRIKVVYEAGECGHDNSIRLTKGTCKYCNGTGKLHPFVGDVIEIDVCKNCGCNLSEDNTNHTIDTGTICQTPIYYTSKDCLQWKGNKRCGCNNPQPTKAKFLSVDKDKQQGLAVEI